MEFMLSRDCKDWTCKECRNKKIYSLCVTFDGRLETTESICVVCDVNPIPAVRGGGQVDLPKSIVSQAVEIF